MISTLPISLSMIELILILLTISSCYPANKAEIANNSCEKILTSNHTNGNGAHTNYFFKDVEIIKNCSSDYENQEIKEKCEFTSQNGKHLPDDIFLYRPVTVKKNNITYWNIYCAICRHQNEEYLIGDVVLTANSTSNKNSSIEFVQIVNNTFLSFSSYLNNWNTSLSSWTMLHDGTIYNTQIHRHQSLEKLPVTKCGESCNYARNNACIISTKLDWSYFTQNHPSKEVKSKPYLAIMGKNCPYYGKNYAQCEVNKFFVQGFDIALCENDEVFAYLEGTTFPPTRCVKVDYFKIDREKLIFVCDKFDLTKNRGFWSNVGHILINTARYISIILLLIHLAISTNASNLKTLCNCVVYSCSSTTLLLYIYNEIMLSLEECSVRYFILIYLVSSIILWTLILIYDAWRVVFSALRDTEASSDKVRMMKYIRYCIFGWTLPLITTWILTYLIENPSSSRCLIIPKYPLYCQMYVKGLKENFSLAYLFLSPLVFGPTFCFVCLVKSDSLRSTIKKSHLSVLSRTTYLMTLYWLLVFIIWVFTKKTFESISDTLICTFLSFQGICVFFLFGFKKDSMRWLLSECGFNVATRTTRTEVSLVQFTQQIIEPLVDNDPM
ncbi:uncharacterized protein LOC135834705 [Planococcus citri]|uniref:uncharacterized protein LOC135834705 n=1 Tax=Planococcus citri TaxID=170843 RepID=UPI0031FA3423